MVNDQPEANHPENVDFESPEGQIEKDIEKHLPIKEEIIDEEYNRLTNKHFRDKPESKRQINASKVVHTFLPKQTDLNKVIKHIEREILKGSYAYDKQRTT